MQVIVGDYSSEDKSSLLARCEAVRSDHDGFLHAGIIHYVQSRYAESNDFPILKAAIRSILDRCPSVWPEDLPERLDAGEDMEMTSTMQVEFQGLNDGLIMPVEGGDVVEVIRLAKRFLAENQG